MSNKEQQKFEEVIKARESRKRRMKFRKQLEILSSKPVRKPVVKTMGVEKKSLVKKLWEKITK